MQGCHTVFKKITVFYVVTGTGINYISIDSHPNYFLSKTLYGDDIFVVDFWKDDLFEDVVYHETYSAKTSHRYHKNKMLRRQETNNSHRLEFFPSDPSNLMDRLHMSSEGKKEKTWKTF